MIHICELPGLRAREWVSNSTEKALAVLAIARENGNGQVVDAALAGLDLFNQRASIIPTGRTGKVGRSRLESEFRAWLQTPEMVEFRRVVDEAYLVYASRQVSPVGLDMIHGGVPHRPEPEYTKDDMSW